MVGKTWDFHVDVALGIPRDENLDMIARQHRPIVERKGEVLFDAEHFFDGYKANPDYALRCLLGGLRSRRPLDRAVRHQRRHAAARGRAHRRRGDASDIPATSLGIHCHNDTENAVANSLAAVRAGARQVQGTLNGLGERCGNANLVSLIPTLMLKMGFETGISAEGLAPLTHVSRLLDERLNRAPNRARPLCRRKRLRP